MLVVLFWNRDQAVDDHSCSTKEWNKCTCCNCRSSSSCVKSKQGYLWYLGHFLNCNGELWKCRTEKLIVIPRQQRRHPMNVLRCISLTYRYLQRYRSFLQFRSLQRLLSTIAYRSHLRAEDSADIHHDFAPSLANCVTHPYRPVHWLRLAKQMWILMDALVRGSSQWWPDAAMRISLLSDRLITPQLRVRCSCCLARRAWYIRNNCYFIEHRWLFSGSMPRKRSAFSPSQRSSYCWDLFRVLFLHASCVSW